MPLTLCDPRCCPGPARLLSPPPPCFTWVQIPAYSCNSEWLHNLYNSICLTEVRRFQKSTLLDPTEILGVEPRYPFHQFVNEQQEVHLYAPPTLLAVPGLWVSAFCWAIFWLLVDHVSSILQWKSPARSAALQVSACEAYKHHPSDDEMSAICFRRAMLSRQRVRINNVFVGVCYEGTVFLLTMTATHMDVVTATVT